MIEAARRYRAIFEEAPARHLAEFEALRAGTHAEAVPVLPRPLWLPAAWRERLAAAAEALTASLVELGRAYFGAGSHAAHMAFFPGAEALARLDAGRAHPASLWRFDLLLDPASGRMTFLECNAGDPSGLGFIHEIAAIFEAYGPFARLGRERRMATEAMMASHRAVVEGRWRRAGGEGTPRVVFAVDASSYVARDHAAMAAAYRSAGWRAEAADPRALEEAGGRLRLGGEPIDVLVRDAIDELLLPAFKEAGERVARAYRAGGLVVVNPFCSVFAESKALFEPLSLAHPALVPWTRRPGAEGAGAEALEAGRERLLLKPVDGYGGEGVLLGLEASPARWREAVAAAVAAPSRWVAQAYAPLPTEDFPTFEGGRYAGFQPRYVTMSAWIHEGRFAGAFGRVGAGRVVNVHQGGALLPVYWLEDAAR